MQVKTIPAQFFKTAMLVGKHKKEWNYLYLNERPNFTYEKSIYKLGASVNTSEYCGVENGQL